MANQFIVGVVIIFLCALTMPPGVFAQTAELPLGHLAIRQAEGGDLYVEARCVETKRVLEEIAAYTKMPVIFDSPCITYFSQLEPSRVTSPEKWMAFIAGNGAELSCQLKDGAWHIFSPTSRVAYDPALTESEIRARFQFALPSNALRADAIASGLLFVNGRMVPPPYSVYREFAADERTIEVKVNGAVIRRFLPQVSHTVSKPRALSSLPTDGQFGDISSLTDYVTASLYPQLLKSYTPKDAQKKVVEFLNSQRVIENTKVDESGVIWINRNTTFFPVNYDLENGTIFDVRGNSITGKSNASAEEADKVVKALAGELRKDLLVFIGAGGVEVSFGVGKDSVARFAAVLEMARAVPLLQAECLLSEIIEIRAMTRELAANLGDDILPKVKAIVSRKEAAALVLPPAPPLE